MKNNKLQKIKQILNGFKAVQSLHSFNNLYNEFCKTEGLTKCEEYLLYYIFYKFHNKLQTQLKRKQQEAQTQLNKKNNPDNTKQTAKEKPTNGN
ncbi:MAG: hypothetical protein IKY67_06725 [Paludibacteraceae bacterium]|nr:hypothetical protein [Paludibacteraceae bacterium]